MAESVMSHASVAALELIEDRLLLAAPTWSITPSNMYITPTGAVTIPLYGKDADNNKIAFSATSSSSSIQAYIPKANRLAQLYFKSSTGVDMGSIIVQLFDDRSPTATNRFSTLATNKVNADKTLNPAGPAFYTNVPVHRVIPNFMIQMGDPVKRDGTGGSPLGKFPDIFNSVLSFGGKNVLAMANSGNDPNNPATLDSNDSQFFITAAPTTWLNQKHTIFGQMISGIGTFNTIINLPRNTTTNKPNNMPVLTKVAILPSTHAYYRMMNTMTLSAVNGFTGAADVTIKMNDGTGNVVSKVVHIVSRGYKAPADIRVTPGIAKTVTPAMNLAGSSVTYRADYNTNLGVTVTYSTAGVLTVKTPTNWTGVLPVELSARFSDQTTDVRTVYVISQKSGDPAVVKPLALPTGGAARDLVRMGNTVYVAGDVRGVLIYDVATPSAPKLLKQFETNGRAFKIKVVSKTISGVAKRFAFVADVTALRVLDVTSVSATKQVYAKAIASGAEMQSLDVVGNSLYSAEGAGGLGVWDIANPAAPVRLATYKGTTQIPLKPVQLVAKTGWVFLTDVSGGTAVIDVRNPKSPVLAQTIGTGQGTWANALSGNYLYIGAATQVVVLNVSNPANPTVVSTPAVAGAGVPSVAGKLLAVGTNTGLTIINIADPTKPVVKYTLAAGSLVSSSGIYGNSLATALMYNGLLITDVSKLLS